MARKGSVGLVAVAVLLAWGGPAAVADDITGDDHSMVKVTAPNRAAAERLGTAYDVAYVTGDRTATVVATDEEIASLRAEGYAVGAGHLGRGDAGGPRQEIRADVQQEARSLALAESGQAPVNPPGEVVIMRAYKFTNYAGTFLYVEAHSKLGTTSATTTANLSVATAGADGVFGDATPFTMPLPGAGSAADPARYTDEGQYMYHRHLQPLTGDATKIRVASDKGGLDEAPITVWLGKQLPPHVPTFQKGFFSRYMDPTEVYGRFDALATDFPDIAQIVPLPNDTNGYQRRAATALGTTTQYTGQTGNFSAAAAAQAVIIESLAMGHEGGNLLTAQLVNPGAPNAPLSVTMNGLDLTVSLATNDASAATSTASQIVARHQCPSHGGGFPARVHLSRQCRCRRVAGGHPQHAERLPQRSGTRPARTVRHARAAHRQAA